MSDFLPDLTFVTPARGRGPGPFGRAVLVLLWVGMCVLPAVLAVPDLRLATGRTGTPGTLTVLSCADLGHGRYDCKGRFTPDSGGPAVAVDASPDSEAGDVLRARLTPEGDRAAPDGTKGVLAALALPAVGLGGIGFLPYVLLYWAGARRRARRTAVAAGCVITAAGALLTVVGMVAAYS
ncbi:hypothetical protein DMB42_17505 [Nonomuraea sp. WAC 01424]|uniref:hypothetical protein n=1 Tax=Nonomuraea sp. WAC 01424 TaxID=2203200 RepID=UPI000F7AFF9A|nr:hypothetical protein [Nonomuraea sp. WAC 01424]RSN10743.1 hypothetical protein DMB42_17505 [Nonomuraea sp. WAC 01424]